MTLAPHQIGDRGQRYEVRYRENDEMPHKRLGWSEAEKGAEQMRKAWRLRPGVTHCWIVDRGPGERGGG